MSSNDLPDDLVLSDAQLREVVERASRVDQRPSGISIATLRQIAAELDIDPAALERALDEVVGLPVPGRPLQSWFKRQVTSVGRFLSQLLPREGRLTSSLAIGTALGWLSGYVAVSLQRTVNGFTYSIGGTAFLDVPIAVFMVILTLANSLARRHEGRLGKYLAETAGLWGAFATAWIVTWGGVSGDLIGWTLGSLTVATIWGIIVVRRRPRLGPPPHLDMVDAHRLPPAKPSHDNEMRRLRIALARLIIPAWVG